MRTLYAISAFILVLLLAGLASSHERQEIEGMTVVFGAEPEPVLDGALCFLRWRFTDKETEQPVADLQDVRLKIKFDGQEFGPFDARHSFRNKGMYQTHHVFSQPGEGEVILTFKKAGEDKMLSLTFPFRIGSRKAISIP